MSQGAREVMKVGADIADRLLRLAAAALRIASRLPKDQAGRHVAGQLVRASTAGGANYEEARGAESREDFIHKVGIAVKEVRETGFWLRLLQLSSWVNEDLDPLVREAQELSAILTASIRTARSRMASNRQ